VVAVAAMLALGAPARADFQAGIDAYARQDYQTALNEWLPYAAQEKPSALFNIGQMYRLGHGVERDLTKAEQYYRRAAELGHIGAMANLGSMMFEQKPPKGDEAVMFWRQAARGGDAKSQYLASSISTASWWRRITPRPMPGSAWRPAQAFPGPRMRWPRSSRTWIRSRLPPRRGWLAHCWHPTSPRPASTWRHSWTARCCETRSMICVPVN
jgi:hypothetical protein